MKQGSTVIGANFHVGDHVLITGLVKNDGPDGRTGVLRKFDTEGQRWKVFLPDQCAVFWVKTAHLSLHDTGGQLQGIKRKVNSQDVDIDETAKVNYMAVDRCIEPLSHMKIGKGKSTESSRL